MWKRDAWSMALQGLGVISNILYPPFDYAIIIYGTIMKSFAPVLLNHFGSQISLWPKCDQNVKMPWPKCNSCCPYCRHMTWLYPLHCKVDITYFVTRCKWQNIGHSDFTVESVTFRFVIFFIKFVKLQ